MKLFEPGSKASEGAATYQSLYGVMYPGSYTGAKDEFLAGRDSAWLGVCLCCTPIYVVSGADAAKVFNHCCVNKDFSLMKEGMSKHALICNEAGHLVADGVVMKEAGTSYRSYWLAPVLQYYVEKAISEGQDVKGAYVRDEFLFQIDGPVSLEVIEEAAQADFHDLAFGRHKSGVIAGKDVMVHRLGMSGALAYEVHGSIDDGEEVYDKLWEILEAKGGRRQGIGNYGVVNHTVAGYANQYQHYNYPYFEGNPELGTYMAQCWCTFEGFGSAGDDQTAFNVYPGEVGWGYLINFDHDFVGRDALLKVRRNPPRKMVTLEWNADDAADVFASQFRGTDQECYDEIQGHNDDKMVGFKTLVRGDKVLNEKGDVIGIATGRTNAYFERRMVSLAMALPEYAEEGRELIVLWGEVGHPQKEIRVRVAQFPYYQGEWRNETFDVEKIPHPSF